MKTIAINETENTPAIYLDHHENEFLFKGESRPEDVSGFYRPIIEWFDQWRNYLYFVSNKYEEDIHLQVNFQLEYFNSSSAKYLMEIVLKIDEINKMDANVVVSINWIYEEQDEDIYNAGIDFEDLTNVKFNFVKLS